MTSTMPEPQIPLTPSSAAASANPGSSDHSSEPMIRKRGSSVVAVDPHPFDRAGRRPLPRRDLRALERRAGRATRRRAAARGCRARSPRSSRRRRRAGPHPRRDAASRRGSRRPCPRRRGRRCTAARTTRAPGVRGDAQLDGPGPDGPVRRERERRRAERGRVDAEQEVVHDRVADERQLEDVRRGRRRRPARVRVTSALSAARTARVISPAPSGWSIAYETRLMRSSPNRICGFITPRRGEHLAVGEADQVPGERRRADVDRDAVQLLVVAGPDRGQRPARRGRPPSPRSRLRSSAGWSARTTCRSDSRPVSPHSRSSASNSRIRSPDGEASSGRSTST